MLWPLFNVTLGKPTQLHVYDQRRCVGAVWSTEGVRQGSVLGPVFFCLALQDALEELQKKNIVKKVRAYIDDVTIVTPPTTAALTEALSATRVLLEPLGIKINVRKTFTLCQSDARAADGDELISAPRGAVRLLGAYIGGTEDEQRAAVTQRMARYDIFFDRLSAVEHRQTAFHLLRLCGLPRASFLLRTHRPAETLQSATHFDAKVYCALLSILDIDKLDDIAERIRVLPARMGGLQMRA